MAITEYFEKLCSTVNLSAGDALRTTVEEKHNLLREKLREKLDITDDFLTGSYRRDTMIEPLNNEKFDVDVLVAFDGEAYKETALPDLRNLVIEALHEIKEEVPELGILDINEEQRRSVGIDFGENFNMDIVPAIEIVKDEKYIIFDKRTLKSLESNPKLHRKLLTEANELSDGKLVRLIKLLKYWKRSKCDYVKSFHIEIMCVHIFSSTKIDSYGSALLTFFTEAQNLLSEACLKDPANTEHLIDAYLDDDNNREKLLELVEKELAVAQEAAQDSISDEDAITLWETVFNDPDNEIANAIDSGSFSSTAAGVAVSVVANKTDNPVHAPKSWKEE